MRATIAMAHSLRKEVVAEGVETQAQLAMLRDLGCDVVQGYLIAKPLPVTQFESFLGLALHSNCVGQAEQRVAA